MDTRKDYVAPAIAAEDALEQTSLACNMTSAVFYWGAECAGQINQKNGGFWLMAPYTCTYPVLDGGPGLCEPAPYGDAKVAQQLGTLFS